MRFGPPRPARRCVGLYYLGRGSLVSSPLYADIDFTPTSSTSGIVGVGVSQAMQVRFGLKKAGAGSFTYTAWQPYNGLNSQAYTGLDVGDTVSLMVGNSDLSETLEATRLLVDHTAEYSTEHS